MSATSGDCVTANVSVVLAQTNKLPVKQLVSVNAAVWLLASVRGGSTSDGCVDAVADSASGVPLASTVALVDHENVKPPVVLQAPSAKDTTPESTALSARLTAETAEPKVVTAPRVKKLGVTLACIVHGAHVAPLPTVPTGQGPHVVGLVHATPA